MEFWARHWGDVASVLGFIITIWLLFKTKSIAAAARDAALSSKSRLLTVDSMADCASAISLMEEIKRLHRRGAWDVVPDRYTAIRRLLLAIHTNAPNLKSTQETMLSTAITQFRVIEEQVDKAAVAKNFGALDPANLNSIVSRQMDEIDRLLNTLRKVEN